MDKIVQLIKEINAVHLEFSAEYFSKHQKVNLRQTIAHIDVDEIYKYRLNLHESINDYLYASKEIISYLYRVKTSESIADKVKRYQDLPIPVNAWMNDIFGARAIVSRQTVEDTLLNLEELKAKHKLQNYVLHPKIEAEEYRGAHLYFKNEDNIYYPWELQIWDEADAAANVKLHREHKRRFVN